MATQAELTAALKAAFREIQGEANPTTEHTHAQEETKVSCPECDHEFEVCKGCGGAIKRKSDDDEDDD